MKSSNNRNNNRCSSPSYIIHKVRRHFSSFFCLFSLMDLHTVDIRFLMLLLSMSPCCCLFVCACVYFVLIKWTQQRYQDPRITWDDEKLIAILTKHSQSKVHSRSALALTFCLAQWFSKDTHYYPIVHIFHWTISSCSWINIVLAIFRHEMLNRQPMKDRKRLGHYLNLLRH